MSDCDCDTCKERSRLEALGQLPAGVCPQALEDRVKTALAQVALSEIGLDPHGFRTAIIICVDKKSEREFPVVGIYRHDKKTDDVCWMPLFAFINASIEDFVVKGDKEQGKVITGADYFLMKMPVEGEPS